MQHQARGKGSVHSRRNIGNAIGNSLAKPTFQNVTVGPANNVDGIHADEIKYKRRLNKYYFVNILSLSASLFSLIVNELFDYIYLSSRPTAVKMTGKIKTAPH